MRFPVLYIVPALLLLFFGVVGFSNDRSSDKVTVTQKPNGYNEIVWSKNYKLKWSDFRGTPDKNSRFKAITTSTLRMTPITYTEEEIQYEMLAVFQKRSSWTKSDAEELLAHEQLHFDISELVMRRMREKFKAISYTDSEQVNKEIKKLFAEAEKERRDINDAYDEETEHGVNKQEQLNWQKMIQDELEDMEAYLPSRVTIKKKN